MSHETAERGRSGLPGLLAYLPPAWVALVLLLSLRQAVMTFPLLFGGGVPEAVLGFIRVSLVVSAVVVPWSLYLLALAFNRSSRFPRQFVIWQVVQLAWLLARNFYVLTTPEFLFGAMNVVWSAAEAAIGLTCIWLVTRRHNSAPAAAPPTRPGMLLAIVAGLLGAVAGAALGFGAGLLAGAGIAELTDMSCFEGACGYFAVLAGLAGGLVGAVAGGVVAVRAARRNPKPRV